jgi:heme O synthase-like polyprenyltransferase
VLGRRKFNFAAVEVVEACFETDLKQQESARLGRWLAVPNKLRSFVWVLRTGVIQLVVFGWMFPHFLRIARMSATRAGHRLQIESLPEVAERSFQKVMMCWFTGFL